MKLLAPLDNEVIFKKVFTDKMVFKAFVNDIVGIDINVGKIETEKKFTPKVGNIDFAYDIFAESLDHRAIIEMQRVEYDYHFDRFLHYHNMAIAELQRSADDYQINRKVYTIVLLTAPYTIKTKDGIPVRDEVLISNADPRTLDGKERNIFGHKLFFLNSYHRDINTPPGYRDWLDLVYASRHAKADISLNMSNAGIKKAVSMITYDHLSPVEIREMKEAEGRRKVVFILNDRMKEVETRLENSKKQFEEEKRRAEEEKRRADATEKLAEDEKLQDDEAEQQVEETKKRANEEKLRAQRAEEEKNKALKKALELLMDSGLSEADARMKLGL